MKYTLGIDQGTTQTTAVVVDENGSFVEKNSVPLPARFPNPGETFIVWDGETGQPVTPAIVWQDPSGVSALGNSLDELSSKWKMETCYIPKMDAVEKERKLSQWRKAVAATQMFHDETKL